MNILVVEDAPHRWQKLSQFLRSGNYSPLRAANAFEAITLLPWADLIMVDAEIASGGAELCRELRTRGYMRPLILVAFECLDEVVASDADDYLEFPFYRPEVLVRVNLLLSRYRRWSMMLAPGSCELTCSLA